MKLEVTRKNHSRIEVIKDGKRRRKSYGVGDTFEGTEKELKAFSDRLKVSDERAKPGPKPKVKEDSKPEGQEG